MLYQELIRAKRDARALRAEEIEAFVNGIASGEVSEGQMAAMAMAVCLNGMDMQERVALTRAMTRSGEVLSWQRAELTGPLLDKHSTGGVGDKVSLVLAPLLAACGAIVPMVSGRGLGHTGGTLDKLDAIPGYCAQPDSATFQKAAREAGCAIVGATQSLAPADRRLYAVRDVTATVESQALITASILCKKLAAGVDALVMDVKTGSGAFAPGLDEARELARSIVDVSCGAGLPARALITGMDQVLGHSAGNAVEVSEAVALLTDARGDRRLLEVVTALSEEALVLGGLAEDVTQARHQLEAALHNGGAAERFQAMVHALGGPADFVERCEEHLPAAPVVKDIPTPHGVVTSMDVRAIGLALIDLGGGRTQPDQGVDHSVGLTDIAAPGDEVGPHRPIARVHARDIAGARRAAEAVLAAITLGEEAPASAPVVLELVEGTP